MSRQSRKSLPLELRWRAVAALPEGDQEVEIAWVRFLDDSTRIGVARMRQDTYLDHELTSAPVPVVIHGWGVLVNGENLTPEPLAFLDALYQGWSVFVEAIPRMAQALTRETSVRAQHEGWDDNEMEVRVEYARGDEPGDPRQGDDRLAGAGDEGGENAANAAPGSNARAGEQHVRLVGDERMREGTQGGK